MFHFNVKVKKCSFEIYGNSVTSYTSLNKDLGTTDDNITLALSISYNHTFGSLHICLHVFFLFSSQKYYNSLVFLLYPTAMLNTSQIVGLK